MPAPDIADTKPRRSILVTGTTGVLGDPMCTRLRADNFDLATLGRSTSAQGRSIVGDLSLPDTISIEGSFDVLVHMAPLWLLPNNLRSIANAGVHRVVAFSSTSVETKRSSKQRSDQTLAMALSNAEHRSRQLAQELNIQLTLLRPTMIYGFGRDKNITAIANFIRDHGFFPIAGSGHGLRQPVHALDLVESSVQCIDKAKTVGKTYNLGGGEQLSYKHMVERIFAGLGRKPRLLHLPVSMYKVLVRIALRLGVLNGVSVGAAQRMNEDLCFDNGPAQRDFGYDGSLFLQNPARDLPSKRLPH